jgi:hypothetical protein
MFETLLIKPIRGFLSYFSNPMSEFPLAYQSELIDEAYEDRGKGVTLDFTHRRCSFIRSTNPITQPST